jgi:HPr kinase/phosphorylase
MERPSTAELMERLRHAVGLSLLTDGDGWGADIGETGTSRPGLLLAGFERGFDAGRIQILGEEEVSFLESLDAPARETALSRLCVPSVPCIVVAGGLAAPPGLVAAAGASGVPVYGSAMDPARVALDISSYLDELLAPAAAVHGTLVDVYGVGLLFTGKSGIGKSECALDLVASGHRLVADDVVRIKRTPQGYLVGTGTELGMHHMEIRGVGIIDVRSMFGIRAIRQRKRIEVEVKLTRWSDVADYERLGFDQETAEVLGVKIPVVLLPLVPGKNITVVSEIIALNHLLRVGGVNTAREFEARLRRLADRDLPTEAYERSDDE